MHLQPRSQDHCSRSSKLGHYFRGERVSFKLYSSSSKSQLQVLIETLERLIKEGYGPRDIAVLFSKKDCIPDHSFGFPYCSATENSLLGKQHKQCP